MLAMSWFGLRYVFGESSCNMSTFVQENNLEGSVIPDSYEGE
ncbi:hypothetical protein HanXRQr2_Chr14g0632541 [Helianthus annuus]|uniref:Uncharacterized protein n=1 Tax=Helianthus annuus TaxID=4232 RepID=A0A9K3E8U6_HELAN|nr:hypothetical protein HanXRQr2_Chr14g0632541 [Helianthus annuus]KAJ0839429.1 hypothetical protein HanPSC8_Chr14g0606701 [Helianthus annuus]